jgi:hypothetical protein
MAQLFGDERCTAAIVEFLGTTEVGLRGQYRREGSDDPGRRFEMGSEGEGEGAGAEGLNENEEELGEDEGG